MDLVKHQWVVTLPTAEAAALGTLRLWPGLELAQLGETLWLRGGTLTQELRAALRPLPGLVGWKVMETRLCRWDKQVPEAILPQLTWRPLSEMLTVSLPATSAAGLLMNRTPLKLTRSAQEQSANVLLTNWETWTTWALTAPAIRVEKLRFAVEARGQAVIWGSPLPPLDGRFFSEQQGVAILCGWACEPALPAPLLREWLGLSSGDLALLEPEGPHHLIHSEQLVAASRPNIRATASLM